MSRAGPPILAALLSLALLACATPERSPPPPDAAPDTPPPLPRCRPAAGVSASPRTVLQLVELANALPRPLTLTCFLESLDRPLEASAAVSTISLQPAVTARSPRLFLFLGPLILSVVPEGKGSSLLEMGELVSPDRSLKAELKFPIEGRVTPDEPFLAVRSGEGTTCRFCHPSETHAPEVSPSAFVSGAFSPLPRAVLGMDSVRAEHASCDPAKEPQRCAFFRALFEHGEVRPTEFPASVPIAFGLPP